MTNLATTHFSTALVTEKVREAEKRAERSRLLAEAGVQNPIRQRIGRVLISAGTRLSPRAAKLAPMEPAAPGC